MKYDMDIKSDMDRMDSMIWTFSGIRSSLCCSNAIVTAPTKNVYRN